MELLCESPGLPRDVAFSFGILLGLFWFICAKRISRAAHSKSLIPLPKSSEIFQAIVFRLFGLGIIVFCFWRLFSERNRG